MKKAKNYYIYYTIPKLGRYDEALRMAEKAFHIDSIQGNTLRMGRRLSQKGDVLMAMGDLAGGEEAYLQAMELIESTDDPTSIAINCKQLSDLYIKKGQRDKALSCLMRALDMATENGNTSLRLNVCQKIYEYYKGYDNALAIEWLERTTALKDSIFNERSDRVLREQQARYETSEKELIIQKQKHDLRMRNHLLIYLGTLLIFLGAILISLLRLRTEHEKRKKAEAEILELQGSATSTEKQAIDELTEYIILHLNEKNLSNDDICRHLGTSQTKLNRQLHNVKGMSIQSYVQKLRMDKAERLLRTTDESISNIANQCGYEDVSYFNRVFKQQFNGMTPSQYRKQNSR